MILQVSPEQLRKAAQSADAMAEDLVGEHVSAPEAASAEPLDRKASEVHEQFVGAMHDSTDAVRSIAEALRQTAADYEAAEDKINEVVRAMFDDQSAR